jgi:hypothetical protein
LEKAVEKLKELEEERVKCCCPACCFWSVDYLYVLALVQFPAGQNPSNGGRYAKIVKERECKYVHYVSQSALGCEL